MADITKIPDSELLEDLNASVEDLNLCILAQDLGIATPDTRARIQGNQRIIDKIELELVRRSKGNKAKQH